jgi:hypothetical protein
VNKILNLNLIKKMTIIINQNAITDSTKLEYTTQYVFKRDGRDQR